jgi:amino acid adenylation domain-containing protein
MSGGGLTTSTSSLSPAKRALLELRLRGLASPVKTAEIPKRGDPARAPLSPLQRQMWAIDQMTPGNPAYNLPYAYRLRGPLDVAALQTAVDGIVARHEALRTTFTLVDGEPQQLIHPRLEVPPELVPLEALPPLEREAALQRLATEQARRAFDLSRLPLVRVVLFRLAEAEHVLLLNLHHIVADGLSIALFVRELDTLYRALTEKREAKLPELAAQYGDYTAWLAAGAQDESRAKRLDFWRERLAGRLPVLELPADLPRPPLQSFQGSNVFFRISAAQSQALARLSAQHGCTVFMTLLAAFQVLLQRYSGASELVIGTPMSARPPQLEPLIGNFLAMGALRCDVTGDPDFLELLRRTRDVTLDALSHGGVPFEAVRFEREPSRNPVFQALFELLPESAPRLGDLAVESHHFDLGFAQCDLSLHLYEEDGGYTGRFEYCSDLFRRATIESLRASFEELLRGIAADPARTLSSLPLLPPADSRRVLHEWNATAAPYSDGAVPALIEAQAERTPERTAVLAGAETCSYAELESRANRIAHTLRARGIGRGQRVGLCLERGVDMLACLLGVLKSGAAYVPLDPGLPEARVSFMAEDAELALVVSTAALAGVSGAARARQLLLDVEAPAIAESSPRRLPPGPGDPRAEDPAYVIYTSGSTGRPKGVVVPHRAIVNFLESMARQPGLRADDVLVAVTTLSFDIAVLELLLPLSVGATVVIAAREQALDGRALRSLLERCGASVLQATPVTWRLLVDAGFCAAPGFKALVGGEALPQDLADALLATGAELWNMYGPTETTVWSTCARIDDTRGGIGIGRPIANTTALVVDAHGKPCPIGAPGELWIGGAGVALGYWKRPALTAERFVPDPWASAAGAMLYRTGDRARWRGDGTLQHLGRLDDQVKLRGFRVELGEIEAAIARHPAVREAAAALREDGAGGGRVVGYLVAQDPPADLAAQLRSLLRSLLPEYMVPARFVLLPALPRTPNGKLDRRALPAPEPSRELASAAPVPPRDALERQLVAAWERLLGTQPIGVNDDFFELGGHSLLAVRLFAEIERSLGRRLPLATLLQAPTIARLADTIRAGAGAPSSLVVPIQPNGSLPPLFCVHAHSGEVLFYKPLARRLGAELPLFAIQARGREGSPASDSVPAMAADYVGALRTIQPHGPYFLAGYCFGAKVAFEMAHRLRELGEDVAFLGLFLAYEPTLTLRTRARRKLDLHLGQLRRLGWPAKLRDLGAHAREKLDSAAWRVTYRLAARRAPRSSSLFRNVPEMHLQAARRYAPPEYAGAMTVFLSGPVPAGYAPDPAADLGGMAARAIELIAVPGDENSMLQEPCVAVLAEKLRDAIARGAATHAVAAIRARGGAAEAEEARRS